MRKLRWKLETVRPHLEAEPAASGPGAVTHRRSQRVVPRTFSSGETEDECEKEIEKETE